MLGHAKSTQSSRNRADSIAKAHEWTNLATAEKSRLRAVGLWGRWRLYAGQATLLPKRPTAIDRRCRDQGHRPVRKYPFRIVSWRWRPYGAPEWIAQAQPGYLENQAEIQQAVASATLFPYWTRQVYQSRPKTMPSGRKGRSRCIGGDGVLQRRWRQPRYLSPYLSPRKIIGLTASPRTLRGARVIATMRAERILAQYRLSCRCVPSPTATAGSAAVTRGATSHGAQPQVHRTGPGLAGHRLMANSRRAWAGYFPKA